METRKQPSRLHARQECEHGWVTDSQHRTSLGTVAYRRCVRCGAYRVELGEPGSWLPASALSRPVPAPAGC